MLSILKSNRYFFVPLFIYFVIGAIVLLSFEKGEVELALNKLHQDWLDHIFKIATYMGDGIVAVIFIALILLFVSKYYTILFSAALILSSVVVHFLKEYVNTPRPRNFFENISEIYYIKDLDIHSNYSFPSGHTAQAFSIFLICALIVKNKKMGMTFFCLALLTGLSRIYLMQHFFIDTYFGTLIAVALTLPVYYFFEKYSKLSKFNSPLIRIK